MGDSASGHLVFSTLLGSIEIGLPIPSSLISFSPWTDIPISTPSYERNNELDPFLRLDIPLNYLQIG